MAIDDNTVYGFTGAQLKALPKNIKKTVFGEANMGVLNCYPYTITTTVDYYYGVESVEILDSDKLVKFLMSHGGRDRIVSGDTMSGTIIQKHSYSYDGQWYYVPDEMGEGGTTIIGDGANLESVAGVRIVESEGATDGQLTFMITASVNTSVYMYNNVRILSQEQLNGCAIGGGDFIGPLDTEEKYIPKAAVQSFAYGNSVDAEGGSWPRNFLAYCPNLKRIYNQAGLPVHVSTVGNYAFSQNPQLTQVDWRTYGDTIGHDVLCNNTALTGVSLGQFSEVTTYRTIGNNFLNDCTSWAPSSSSKLTVRADKIGNFFLAGCSSFAGTVVLDGVSSIGDCFMQDCTAYNAPLDLRKVTSIGSYFLDGCTAYAQPIVLGRSLSSLGAGFLQRANSVPSVDVKDIKLSDVANLTTDASKNTMLSTNNSSATSYTTGITLTGDAVQNWMDILPNRTSSPYRKLLNGNS